MLIRRFKSSDLDAILELFHTVVHSVGAKYYNQQQVHAWAPKEGLNRQAWLKSLTENITLVAEVDEKIVGFSDMTHTGYIDRMYIDKNHQGQGIARAMFKQLEEVARKLGLQEMIIDANVIVKPLAEKAGFEMIRELYKIRQGVEFINYLMRKKLSH